jgi:hypothetical protein
MELRNVLAALVLSSIVAAAAAADPALVTAYGKVEIGHGTPPVWHVAQSGDALAPGDSVRTSAGARAELQLGDNRIVRVYEQSMLRVGTSVTPTGAVRSVDLDQGQSIFDVMKKAVADEFDVVTPEVVVSVKGTRFLVAAVEGADYTSVFRGEVSLAGKGFETVFVRPGMTGAHGELFLTPFADPWAAWETGSSAPAPAIDGRRAQEVGTAIQVAVGGSGSGGSGAGSRAVGALLARVTDPLGAVLAPVTNPVVAVAPVKNPVGALAPATIDPAGGGSPASPVAAAVGGGSPVSPVVAAVGGGSPVSPVVAAVGGGSLVSPVVAPAGGGSLLGSLLNPLVGSLVSPVVAPAGGGSLVSPVVAPAGGGSLLSPVLAPVGGLLGKPSH